MANTALHNRRPIAGALLLGGVLLAGFTDGISAEAPRPESAGLLDEAKLREFVDTLVEQWQVCEQDRRFDEIGWVKTLAEARELARERDRPVFLFTHDGRIAIGRC